jgi:serine/threonine-protein kinase
MKRADEIFGDALELNGDDRDRFVDAACAGDTALLAEVRSLLAAHADSQRFLEVPVARLADVDDARSDPMIGRTVGPYRIVRPLGSGGMGRVYLAERAGDFLQRVAVKLIVRGAYDDEAFRRFRNECRVLALLEHPNIARMIDGGTTDDGAPYIAMEFVDGVPIDGYVEERSLSVRERLFLFLDVCAAVEHVHRHATIHRDVKPGNILVSREGSVKLVDFGIARVLDAAEGAAERTATIHRVMTPAYASPEQLRGEALSTASDVYSLGVVLFRLLTGTLPFDTHSRSDRELERVVSTEPPPRPSDAIRSDTRDTAGTRATSRQLRGDLDTIVLTALRKEPERRYRSAGEFADDVRRYLEGRPVAARQDSAAYRARKFVSRHAALVTGSAVVLLIAISAAIVGFSLYRRAERERVASLDAQRIAEGNARTAERVTGFLVGLFEDTDPNNTGSELTATQMLTRGTERVESELDDEPRAQARLLRTLAEVWRRRGDLEQAGALCERAVAAARSSGDAYETAECLTEQGMYFERVKEYPRALAVFLEAESLTVAAGKVENQKFARLLNGIGMAYLGLGDLRGARPYMQRSTERRAAVIGADNVEMAYYYLNLAEVHRELGQYREAEPLYARARALREANLEPNHPQLAFTYLVCGAFMNTTGRASEARPLLERALEIQLASLGERHFYTAAVSWELGRSYEQMGDDTRAAATYRRAIRIFDELVGPDNPSQAEAWCGLGRIELRAGHIDQAAECFERALASLETAYGPEHVQLAEPLTGLGMVASQRRNFSDSVAAFERALRVREAAVGDMHPLLPEILDPYAAALDAVGRSNDAVVARERANTIRKQAKV